LEDTIHKKYNYDDIISIDIVNMIEITDITDLPANISNLKIVNTTLSSITIPQNCKHLHTLHIEKSNIRKLDDDLEYLEKLTALKIRKSFLETIPKKYPKSLVVLDFDGNCLSEENTDITHLPKQVCTILFNNWFEARPITQGHYICWGTQLTQNSPQRLNKKPITNYEVHHQETRRTLQTIYQHYNYTPNIDDAPFIHRNAPNVQTIIPRTNIFNSTQTVHHSSIVSSVAKSVDNLLHLTAANYSVNDEDMLINEFIYEAYWKKRDSNGFINALCTWTGIHYLKNVQMVYHIRRWINCNDMRTIGQDHIYEITYKSLLARIWLLIKKHPKKTDFIENVKIELYDSIGVCFTGRFNRLVNSLVGFIDGATVGISVKEQLQLEIGNIIGKLSKGELTYSQCKKEIIELFEQPEVLEDNTITTYYKDSWLNALEEFNNDESGSDTTEERTPLIKNCSEWNNADDHYNCTRNCNRNYNHNYNRNHNQNNEYETQNITDYIYDMAMTSHFVNAFETAITHSGEYHTGGDLYHTGAEVHYAHDTDYAHDNTNNATFETAPMGNISDFT
jgi:hypothetical protein